MRVTFYNQWKKTSTDFSAIIFEYQSPYNNINNTQDNIFIVGLLGFVVVIAFNVDN